MTIVKPREGDFVSSIACVGDLEFEEEPKNLNGTSKDSKDGKAKE